mgnify:CR=1 FL=1
MQAIATLMSVVLLDLFLTSELGQLSLANIGTMVLYINVYIYISNVGTCLKNYTKWRE